MTPELKTALRNWFADNLTTNRGAKTATDHLLRHLQRRGYTIRRTELLDLADRKSAHGCTDALCGECDQ